MNKRTDKRVRLIEAADKLFYEQGVNVTTLANIASLADVPLGNVYYYFKSKDSIVVAVLLRRREMIQSLFTEWNTLDAKARLKSLITYTTTSNAQAASFGDWLGNICQELCKQSNDLSTAAADLLKDVMKWCESQFKAMGKGEKSTSLAVQLMANLQGTTLLTMTFKDPAVVAAQNANLINWLESA